jgi:hypothetical protein
MRGRHGEPVLLAACHPDISADLAITFKAMRPRAPGVRPPRPLITKIALGRLPGDIVIERENFRLYLPLATSLIVSIVLSVLLWLLNR